ncbi:hypothetical protein ABT084_34075 [Streptomyces sp. NPDC002138]|uniref:hypothetical protein n=1 Tax=Streptomyces sp. NPDC002138 TaxID=3154410 RepID=UPI0033274C59
MAVLSTLGSLVMLMALRGFGNASWGIMCPAVLWVVRGAALGAATYPYRLRRRGNRRSCARG